VEDPLIQVVPHCFYQQQQSTYYQAAQTEKFIGPKSFLLSTAADTAQN
jgi:hypothetical protein